MVDPRLRRLVLVTHVVTSVGWLGAVAVFLALAVLGLTSADPSTVRGAYLVMRPTGTFVLVPLAVASLATGVLSGIGTNWGLVKHYWVLIKLLITAASTLVLVLYLRTFQLLAQTAADPTADLAAVRNFSPALHSGLALLALVVTTVLAVYKPKGATGLKLRRAGAGRVGARRCCRGGRRVPWR